MGALNTVASYEIYAKVRDQKEMIDSQVAEASGVPQSTLSDWKSGRSNPKFDKVSRIAVALGVPVMELYGR